MDHASIFSISTAGMQLERTRAEVAALNLANAHATAAPGQAAYRPLRVVPQWTGAGSFGDLMAAGVGTAAGATVRIEAAPVAPRRVHEPGHPHADGAGFVSYPGVDPATEMVSLMSATRAYEAHVAVASAARAMALKTLEIGGGQ